VASPSGGGKTTLIRRVMQELSAEGREAHFSISHTTRAPRACERDGVDYYFVDRPAFQAMAARGEFLEFAEVHGNLYGTSRAEVEGRLERGCDVFLDIDPVGGIAAGGPRRWPRIGRNACGLVQPMGCTLQTKTALR